MLKGQYRRMQSGNGFPFISVFSSKKLQLRPFGACVSKDFPCGRNSFDSKLQLIGIMLATSRSVFEIQFEVFICLCVSLCHMCVFMLFLTMLDSIFCFCVSQPTLNFPFSVSSFYILKNWCSTPNDQKVVDVSSLALLAAV